MAEQNGSRRVLFCAFNQDHSCLAMCTREGYKIFNCDSCACCYQRSDGAISLAEMLFSTSIVAVVGAGEQPALSPRRLNVYNTTTEASIAELNFVSSILAVRMNRKRLIVVLERKTFIHDLARLTALESIDTVSNPKGLCAFSSNHDNCYLALPASTTSGAVLVYDALDLHALCQIQAHRAPLAAMALSADGFLLATASEQGTVIRVHVIPQGSKAFTFRRGSYPSAIYSLSFGPPSQYPQLLAANSASGTVHIFRLDTMERLRNRPASGLLSAVIPDSMTDMVDSERCFITIRNGFPPGVRSYCAIAAHPEEVGDDGQPITPRSNKKARVLVVTSNGYFHEYWVTVGSGREGSCTLERECALLTNSSDQIFAHFV
ncbi:unnamed protein product [Calypogeia fissa]